MPTLKNKMISLCMITKNSESRIAKTLESVRNLVSEMIIVDTGSSDNTKSIAMQYGAEIYDFPWTGNFSEARNFAYSKATQPWILNLDDDETIAEPDIQKIKDLIKDAKHAGFFLIQRNYTSTIGQLGWISSNNDKYEESKVASGYTTQRVVRLFKNDSRIKSEGVIHDNVLFSIEALGNIGETDIPIHHSGFLSVNRDKIERYVAMEIKNRRNDFYQEYQIGTQLHSLGRFQEALSFLINSVRLNPEFYLSWLEMAIIFMQSGKVVEAKPLLLKSLSLQEYDATLSHLALVEIAQNNQRKAFEYFERALQLNSKNADTCFNYGLALKHSGNKEKARAMLEKAAELNYIYKDKVESLLKKIP